MKHYMKLQAAPFALIAAGVKTVELRLYDEKRKKLTVGDEIEFTNVESGARLCCTVVALHKFPTFAALYAAIPLLKCVYTAQNVASASPADMEQYYTKEEQRAFGVVGIEIALISE